MSTVQQETIASPSPEVVDRLAHPSEGEVAALDAWWRANNYLTVGQIYLMANPLLREPLDSAHIKPRLLGHWGTSPGCPSSMRTRHGSSSRPGSNCSTSPGRVTVVRPWSPPATSRAPTPRSTRG